LATALRRRFLPTVVKLFEEIDEIEIAQNPETFSGCFNDQMEAFSKAN